MSKQQEALRFLDDLDSLNADTVAVTIPSNNTPSSSSSDAQATTQGTTINQSTTTTQARAESQTQPGNEADALAFLDEITQKSQVASTARSTPPSIGLSAGRSLSSTPRTASRISLRKGADGNVSISRSASPAFGKAEAPTPAASTNSGANSSQAAAGAGASGTSPPSGGSWGWSSVWSSASAAVKQARTVVDEQVKNLPVTIPNVPIPNNEQAKKWSEGMLEYVKTTQLDKIGS